MKKIHILLVCLLVLAIILTLTICFSKPGAPHLAAVKIGNKWGYIDKSGKIKIPPQFDSAHNFSNGLAQVKIAGKSGYINTAGKVVVPLTFTDPLGDFSEGFATIAKNQKINDFSSSKPGQFIFGVETVNQGLTG